MINELKDNLKFIYDETQEKLIPENLKKDVTLLGVTGTLEGGVMTEEEYNTCDNLANLILGDIPLIDDPNISVTLDVSNNDTINVENNTLIIEEVVE